MYRYVGFEDMKMGMPFFILLSKPAMPYLSTSTVFFYSVLYYYFLGLANLFFFQLPDIHCIFCSTYPESLSSFLRRQISYFRNTTSSGNG